MPIDNEKIKTALDDFENDDFISAKDTLKAEIKGAISDYFKDKLELQNDLEPKANDDTGGNDDNESDTDIDSDSGGEGSEE